MNAFAARQAAVGSIAAQAQQRLEPPGQQVVPKKGVESKTRLQIVGLWGPVTVGSDDGRDRRAVQVEQRMNERVSVLDRANIPAAQDLRRMHIKRTKPELVREGLPKIEVVRHVQA